MKKRTIKEEKRTITFIEDNKTYLAIVSVNGKEVSYKFYETKKEFNAAYKGLQIRQALKTLNQF